MSIYFGITAQTVEQAEADDLIEKKGVCYYLTEKGRRLK